MIHGESPNFQAPVVCIDCDRLDGDTSELLGCSNKRSILDWVPYEGTVILNNVHKAPPAALPLLQEQVVRASLAASMSSIDTEEAENGVNHGAYSFPRIIMIAETRVPALEGYGDVIKVPPLRLRAEDIADLAKHILRTIAKARGLGSIELSPGAIKKLEAAQYPNNVRELESALERAVALKAGKSVDNNNALGVARVLMEDDFWFESQEKELTRLNLLNAVPGLRDFLRSEWWPSRVNNNFTVYAFAFMVGVLFLGPQDREHNFALITFWCYWWPLSFVVFPFLGRIWCSVCPFMIYGELVQRWRLGTGAKLMKWPKEQLDRWGQWFLFTSFAGILIWEEVWDLPHTAYLSAWLLVLITTGAVIGSFFYEKRIFCRWLCPIGGMNGLFAKLSMTELRARPGVCAAECDSYACIKGSGPEDTAVCPQNAHSGQLTDNRLCVMCMQCLKNCPNESIEMKLRVPGADLWEGSHVPMAAEVCLLFMLLGDVYLHNLPAVLADLNISPENIIGRKIPHMLASVGMLATPGVAAWGVDALWRRLAATFNPSETKKAPSFTSFYVSSSASSGDQRTSLDRETARAISILESAASSYSSEVAAAPVVAPAKPFMDLAYGYLPLVWAGILAYYMDNLLSEAGRIGTIMLATFGIESPAQMPEFVAHPAVVDALQATLLTFGGVVSLAMTRRIANQPWAVVVPQCITILAFTAGLWHVTVV